VHVRRLRAKLGPENEQMIGTVRNVGYRFVPESARVVAGLDGHPADGSTGDDDVDPDRALGRFLTDA